MYNNKSKVLWMILTLAFFACGHIDCIPGRRQLIGESSLYALRRVRGGQAVISDILAVIPGKVVGKLKVVKDVEKNYEELINMGEEEIAVVEHIPDRIGSLKGAGLILPRPGGEHLRVRIRGAGLDIPYAVLPDAVKRLEGWNEKWVVFEVTSQGGELRLATAQEVSERQIHRRSAIRVEIPQADLKTDILVYNPFGLHRVVSREDLTGLLGNKFGDLDYAGIKIPSSSNLSSPSRVSLTFAFFYQVLEANPQIKAEIERIEASIDKDSLADIEDKLGQVRAQVENLTISDELKKPVDEAIEKSNLRSEHWAILRTGTNADDLDRYPGIGKGRYRSFYPLDVRERDKLWQEIKKNWASKWNLGAFLERETYHIPHSEVEPAVSIEVLIPADWSFSISTVDPITGNINAGLIKVAQGLGEGLFSDKADFAGLPHQFIYAKTPPSESSNPLVDMLIQRITISDKKNRAIFEPAQGRVEIVPADYSNDPFAQSSGYEKLVSQIGHLGNELEAVFKRPVNVEGVIYRDFQGKYRIYLVEVAAEPGFESYPNEDDYAQFYQRYHSWAESVLQKFEPILDIFNPQKEHPRLTGELTTVVYNLIRDSDITERVYFLRLFSSLGTQGYKMIKKIFFYSSFVHEKLWAALELLDKVSLAQDIDRAVIDWQSLSDEDKKYARQMNDYNLSRFFATGPENRAYKTLPNVQKETLAKLIEESYLYYFIARERGDYSRDDGPSFIDAAAMREIYNKILDANFNQYKDEILSSLSPEAQDWIRGGND